MTRDKLTKKIEKCQEIILEDPRDYIGASIIGSECLRQIWYEYKGVKAERIPTKTWRTWQIGKSLEGLVLDWLDLAGFRIIRKFRELVSKCLPCFKGHLDSVLVDKNNNPVAIIEIKTAKNASYNIFVKKGVKLWQPVYYAQIQAYMGMSGIHKTYILVLNKDNSEISDELVTFDEEFYKALETKALLISTATVEPPRISGSPLWHTCKMCKFNKVCHK